jgi:hypothetical protein
MGMARNPNKHKEPIMGVRLFGRIGKPIWAASAATCGGLFVYGLFKVLQLRKLPF